MKLLHYAGLDGASRIGIQRTGATIVDLQTSYARLLPNHPPLPTTIDGLLEASLLERVQEILSDGSTAVEEALATSVVAGAPQIRSALLHPGKIIGVGTNYKDHAEEVGVQLPVEPVFFAKFQNALTGPQDVIPLPRVSEEVDWEAELVVVIGRRGHNISESEAMSFVAGYTVGNDISARDWQLRKPLRQWTLGKSFDGFLPLGPALVTADEIQDPYNLELRCVVSGEVMQAAPTRMHFNIPRLIAYFSQVATLEPGDIFLTGTPAGVGMNKQPPRFLRDGDVVVTSIEHLGEMRNSVLGASGLEAQS
jgi:2-keto-4-pentenoate hydratase/2-oxohepta-3-ene-1,7-dioic acid hydratase in catechol pathway